MSSLKVFLINILGSYDAGINEGIHHFQQQLPERARPDVQSVIDDFRTMTLDGRQNRPGRVLALAGDRLVVSAGAEDNENENESNLQSNLCSIVDDCRATALEELLRRREDWPGKSCLEELRDETVSHEWLWSLNPCHGPIVPPTHYLVAVRLRLGAPAIEIAMTCPRCGREELDRSCTHAFYPGWGQREKRERGG